MSASKLGLYLHIPFCVHKCAYCDFYSVTDPQQMQAYEQALTRQLTDYGKACSDYTVDTIYFGGGTPSCLGGQALARLLQTLFQCFTVEENAEITVEANPESMTADFLSEIRAAGANRLSMGMQSSSDAQLQRLGRVHTFAQAVAAYERAQTAGFSNISIDLMYGLPEQSLDSWRQSISDILALQPAHISCYGLKLEPGTPLFRAAPPLPDEDTQADQYLLACEMLRSAGYRHYEISNFALNHQISRHNSRYWDLSEYLGLGPGAHSFFGGRRFAFCRNLNRYVAGVMANCEDIVEDEEEIPGFQQASEYLMLMLRTDFGIDGDIFREKFHCDFEPYERVLNKFQKSNHAEKISGRWRLTETGFLVSNAIIGEVLQEEF